MTLRTIGRVGLTIGAAAGILLTTAPTAATQTAKEVSLPLTEAVAQLTVEEEDRTGYQRDAFKHWVDEDRDGCDTRAEVLKEEAIEAPEQTGRCTLGGGVWHSYYDEIDVEGASGLDIDHVVPLAEAWDSGASEWTAERREAYANDLGDERSLVAVTARSNRQKADKDPQDWMPPAESATCRYIEEWTAVKTRWGLAVDPAEAETLAEHADQCPDTTLTVTLAP